MQKQASMTSGAASPGDLRRMPTAVLGVAVALSLVGLGMVAVAWSHLDPSDAYPAAALPIAATFFALLGWLILRRTSNVIGWLLLGEGAADGLMLIASIYAVLGAV
ncbi:MAG TPA: hypothetical protein VGQ50_04745, partial [Actinomycetota bacterium]|nr:hypothetical protein [Actinomycetota bacterium]